VVDSGSWQGELAKVNKQGKPLTVTSRWTLVRDEQGKPKSILSVDTDITEQKKLAAQFLRAQRLESIGTLAGGIAHDLNNVLAPILMSIQLLQIKYPNDQNRQLLNLLEANVKRGAALVKQVLSFARGIEGDRTIVQVKHLILEIANIIKETFPKSIELYTNIASDLETVLADATQLHQVLMNLVVNARDAMPNGGSLTISAANIEIDISYAQTSIEAKVGSYIVITVADTGTGIAPEIIERIFDPFFTTKEVGQGTGLGLSTSLGIIKSHGGFLEVCSFDKGSKFKVYLPISSETKTQLIEQPELLTGQGELVLVVDDEATICKIAKTALEGYNYKVLTANDGIDALTLYAQNKHEISVVLLDMMMPKMDGISTIRILQKINPLILIIATSGIVSSDNITLAMRTGAKAFLPKPYTAQELLKVLQETLINR
jgi:two-component system, cell cycle sensor histidine kinase and response regulator CckA